MLLWVGVRIESGDPAGSLKTKEDEGYFVLENQRLFLSSVHVVFILPTSCSVEETAEWQSSGTGPVSQRHALSC